MSALSPGAVKRILRLVIRATKRALFGKTRVEVHDPIDKHAVQTINVLVDLAPIYADGLCIREKLVSDLVYRDDVRLRRLGNIVLDPLMQEVDAACAHSAISRKRALGSMGRRGA